MSEELNPMRRFDFLLGKWKLLYKIPKSSFSNPDSGEGEGEFKSVLKEKYVTFDYSCKLFAMEDAAHAIFVWDAKTEIYRYWWFEDSGAFMEASCNFLNDTTLCLNWHNSLLVQTFQLTEDGRIILRMKYPSEGNNYETILEVVFTKKQ